MASRHLARSIAMQTLYEVDFRDVAPADAPEILERNFAEFGPGLEEKSFARSIVTHVLERKAELDNLIEKAAPEWPIAQIAIVDRNVLRIGLWELLFGNYSEVPPKVSINEAIELAKTFGGEKSGKFINGVLGTIYREIGEPGKNETSRKQMKPEDLEKLPVELKVGGVVYRKDPHGYYFALVHDVFGYWTLAKGSIEGAEAPKDGVRRELEEELGISNMDVGEKLGVNEYVAHDPEKGPVRRRVEYFLVETSDEKLTLGPSGGLTKAQWFSLDELANIKTYPDIVGIFKKAFELLQSQ